MKAMKKLIPALCLLLISAVLMGTSTYAWFAMNTKVTAKGMTVNAKTESSLVIKADDEPNYTAVGTAGLSQTEMKPVTSYDGVGFGKLSDGVKVENAHASTATWTGTNGDFQAGDLTKVEANSTDPVYVATATYKIKNIGAGADVYVTNIKVSADSGTNELKAALRISVQMGGGNVLVFNAGGGTADKVGKLDGTTWSLVDPQYVTVDCAAANLGSLEADDPQDVIVQIWFEGQDSMCYSDAVSTKNISVEIEFSTSCTGA